MHKKFLLLFFLATLLTSSVIAGEKSPKGRVADLDGTAIDLLVGAPGGVVEPLDERRTRPLQQTELDFSKFLDYDTSFEEADTNEITWQDGEEPQFAPEDENENFIDLIAEIEDYENQQYEGNETEIDSIVADNIETEMKL